MNPKNLTHLNRETQGMWKNLNSAMREAFNPDADGWTTKGVFRIAALLLGLLWLIATIFVVLHSVLTNDADWRGFTSTIPIVVGWAVSVLRSISLTHWILLVLAWIAFGIYASNREILAKLEDIESELSNIRPDVGTGSYLEDDDDSKNS